MSNEKKPFTMDKKKVLALLILVLTLSLLVASNYPPKTIVKELEQPAKFVIASWDYPDEYGQGIEAIEVYENSTGSWVLFETYAYDDDTSNIDWNESVAIKLRCYTWFNSTLTGVSTTNEGKLYQRHSVTVTNLGSIIFSQQNFTYFYAEEIEPLVWYYGYEVVLNFLPVGGEFYTVVVTYEIFW